MLAVNQLPGGMPRRPSTSGTVVLLEPPLGIFAYADVEALSTRAPEDINVVNLNGNAGHEGWLRGLDLNQRPLGYEPNELPGCSTPQFNINKH